ncbi:hypothetical protein PHAMO_400047 [Magnetospirillum molischianum DSM 120]|uniref:Uncharacterized protein n=1 Tax=Magnetospirillum molischianum DSM 120 TaxID=1150626 RepID=H8FWC8_MAGML|nr:hypothetical protein PHAMO_400047 [Magnetospirillum molischianum DSM 120]
MQGLLPEWDMGMININDKSTSGLSAFLLILKGRSGSSC